MQKILIILRVELERLADGTVAVKNEGYIPCEVYKNYIKHNYLVVPLSPEYNGGLITECFDTNYERIKGVIGDKIPVLGTYNADSESRLNFHSDNKAA